MIIFLDNIDEITLNTIDLNSTPAEKLINWQTSFGERQIYLNKLHKSKTRPLEIYFMHYPVIQQPFGISYVIK